MRRLPLLVALLVAAALPVSAPAGEEEPNRVANGDFETGDPGATKLPGWTEVDGLTTFFVSEPGHGRVLLIDTDVKLSEADERAKEMEKPAKERPPARKKGPTKPPKYDTVGGTTGAKIYSDYFRVEPEMRYRLRVDVKSAGPEVLVFVKGYSKFQGGFRKFYQCYKKAPAGRDGWHTYERTFNPTLHSPEVSYVRVMPYAYWPPGKAWIDNISITRIGPDETGPPAPGKNLLENGDFEAAKLAPFVASGEAARVERGSEGACVRLPAGSSLEVRDIAVEEKRGYVLKARVLPQGAVLTAVVQMVVRMDGKDYVMEEERVNAPPSAEDWVEVSLPFNPTGKTPQVTKIHLKFEVGGTHGGALVDDVSLEATAGSGKK